MVARRDILSRLADGDRLVLDGGTGSELQRRGVNVSRGVAPNGGLGAWSATALGDAPEVVREIHEDYLRAGADIVTTNSFWTNRLKLATVGQADKSEEYTRLAVDIARRARDKTNPDAYVAGSIAPSGLGDLQAEFREQVATLTSAGADVILFEYVGTVSDAVMAADAAADAGLPVFIGIRHVTMNGTTQYGETVEQLVAALKGRRVDAILTMCSDPEAISATLPGLRRAFDGTIGAYANIGYKRAPEPPNYPERQWHVTETSQYMPERYAQYGRVWLDMGAQIIGGCCATGPEHIAALQPAVSAVTGRSAP